MAIRIEASLSKKLPIAGTDFSSQQAGITISAEVHDPSQVVAEAQHLYRLAEQAVDQQLAITQTQPTTPPRQDSRPSYPSRPGALSRPGPGRRSPPPATDSQLRLLRRLLGGDTRREQELLHHYQANTLELLTIAEASAAIDDMKRVAS